MGLANILEKVCSHLYFPAIMCEYTKSKGDTKGMTKGRPLLADDAYRGGRIQIRVTQAERTMFEKLADKRNQTVSDMVRDLVNESLKQETSK